MGPKEALFEGFGLLITPERCSKLYVHNLQIAILVLNVAYMGRPAYYHQSTYSTHTVDEKRIRSSQPE